MKFKNLLLFVIYIVMVLPSSIASKDKKGAQAQTPVKVNGKGEFQPYHGYTIAAMIDTELVEAAQQIEELIRKKSSLKKRYAAVPASSYHMSFYNIYSCGSNLIPPVARWAQTSDVKISHRNWLPFRVLHEHNKEATCIMERYLNETLNIKYADIYIGKKTLSLSLEVEPESLERIQNVRKELAKVYEHQDSSMEPINEKLRITLAYVYGNTQTADPDALNQLNQLSRAFNGVKLSLPSVYLYSSMEEYIEFERNFNCTGLNEID